MRGGEGQPDLRDHRRVRFAGNPRQRPRRMVRAVERRDPMGGRRPRHRRRAGPRHDEAGRRRGDAGGHPAPGLLTQTIDPAGMGK